MVTLQEIKDKEKTGKSYWSHSQRFRHQLGYPITKLILKTPLTANMITVFWIIQQIIGASLLLYGTYLTMLAGVTIFNLSFVLDAVDGQIARFRQKITYTGYYLDKIGHWAGTPALFVALGIGTFIKTDQIIFTILGLAIAFLHLLIELIDFNGFWSWCDTSRYPAEGKILLKQTYQGFRVSALAQKNWVTKYIFAFFKRGQLLNVLFLGVLLDVPQLALILYFMLFSLKFIFKLTRQIQSLKKIDDKLS